ncbi:dihydropteroate synthase [Gordonia terrae]|uniref:dihydropteroate synthase n=1 Tax=Gordonia terrae TaxID=2055 RepID=UPI003F6ACF19
MGIVNVTPDSFSDGGRYVDSRSAIEHALQMSLAGADMIDVGGESTRPGAERVDPDEEMRRVLPVIGELSRLGVSVSVDTMRASVAARALDAGAILINDVSGGRADSHMIPLVAEAGVAWVLNHWRGHSRTMSSAAQYADTVTEVRSELLTQADRAVCAGIRPEQIILDPGFGFAKRPHDDLALLAGIDDIVAIGLRVLVGTSRKSFLGTLLQDQGVPRPVQSRDAATLATTVLAARAGVWAVRVHDVAGSVDGVQVEAATRRASRGDHSTRSCTGRTQPWPAISGGLAPSLNT